MRWGDFSSSLTTAVLLVATILLAKRVSGIAEGIGMDPTNTYGMELGEFSLAQYAFFMLVVLKLTLLYAMGILPLEYDFSNGFMNSGNDGFMNSGNDANGFMNSGNNGFMNDGNDGFMNNGNDARSMRFTPFSVLLSKVNLLYSHHMF